MAGPGLKLDLTSTNANIILGSNLFATGQSISITLGTKSQTFGAGASVTAAEYVAIRQVLAGGHQTLKLSDGGNATSGNFSINGVSSTGIGELVVPKGVTAFDYATPSSLTQSQTISGDIINFGTIYGVAHGAQNNTISLNALDITNEAGATIATRSAATGLSINAGDQLNNAGDDKSLGQPQFVECDRDFHQFGLDCIDGQQRQL